MPTKPRAEFLDEFLVVSAKAIQEAASDLAAPARVALAQRLLDAMLDAWGGCQLYLPKRSSSTGQQARNQAIFEQYDGTNATRIRLARQYGITTSQVYRVVSTEYRRRRQAGARATAKPQP